jgi:hypothetical protein
MFRRKIIFVILITVLIFIFLKVYQYKNEVQERLLIENLENKKDVDGKKLHLKNNTPTSIMKYVVETVKGAMKNIRPDRDGPVGPQGPEGPPGKSGGTHLEKGMLRSINSPGLFLERETVGLSVNKPNYKARQRWTYTTDNKLKSSVNQHDCLNYSDDKKLEIKNCLNSRKWDYREKNSSLQTRIHLDDDYYCLTLTDNPEKGSSKRYGVILDKCTNNKGNNTDPKQQWSFY